MEKFAKSEKGSRRGSVLSLMGALSLAGMLSSDVHKTPTFDISAMFANLDQFAIDTPEKLLEELKNLDARRMRLAPVDALYTSPVPQLTEEQRRVSTLDALSNPTLIDNFPEGFSSWVEYRINMQTQGYTWWLQYDHIQDREIRHRNDSFFDGGVEKVCYREGATVIDRVETELSDRENDIGVVSFISLAKPSPFSRDVQPVSGLPHIEMTVTADGYPEAFIEALAQVRKTLIFQQVIDQPAMPGGIERPLRHSPRRESIRAADGGEVTYESRSASVQFCMAGVRLEIVPGTTNQYTFVGFLGEPVSR